MSEQVVRIRCTIEPRVHGSHTEVIELDASEFEALSPEERKSAIRQVAEDWAAEQCPWGYEELTDDA